MLLCIGSETYLLACNCLLGGNIRNIRCQSTLLTERIAKFRFKFCADENIST